MLYPTVGILGVDADLDGIVENGTYEARSPVNGPDTGDWLVAVLKSPLSTPGDVEVVQVAFKKADGAAYSRSSNAGSWSDWAAFGGGGGATLPTGVKGDILVNNGTAWVVLTGGTEGQLLSRSDAAATGLAWINPA